MNKITFLISIILTTVLFTQNTLANEKSVNSKVVTNNMIDKNISYKIKKSFNLNSNDVFFTQKYKNNLFYYKFITDDTINTTTINKLSYHVADEMILSGNYNGYNENKYIKGTSSYSEITNIHTRAQDNIGLIEATYNYIFNTLFKFITTNYVSFGVIQSEKDGVTNGFTASIYPTPFTEISYSHAEEKIQDISKFSFYYYHGKSSRIAFKNVIYKEKVATNYDTLTGIEYQLLF